MHRVHQFAQVSCTFWLSRASVQPALFFRRVWDLITHTWGDRWLGFYGAIFFVPSPQGTSFRKWSHRVCPSASSRFRCSVSLRWRRLVAWRRAPTSGPGTTTSGRTHAGAVNSHEPGVTILAGMPLSRMRCRYLGHYTSMHSAAMCIPYAQHELQWFPV